MAKILTKAVTRLQKFLAAIAGDATAPTPVTNQEKLLFNIAEEMKAASSSELPKITAANDGQVLTANSGVWVAANPSGGTERFVVTFSFDMGENGCTSDKTFAECVAAWNGGKVMFANDEQAGTYIPVSTIGYIEGGEIEYFSFVSIDADSRNIDQFTISTEGVFYVTTQFAAQ